MTNDFGESFVCFFVWRCLLTKSTVLRRHDTSPLKRLLRFEQPNLM
jgi:hypothetical protein